MISNKNRLTVASPDSEVSLYAPIVDEAENMGDNSGDMFLDDGGFDEDNLFLESESEAEEFFDVIDTEEEAGESDYGVDSIPVIPEIKTVGEEESMGEDTSEIAEDVENVFILLLSDPDTRNDIIKLVSGRTASGRNGSDFVKRYMKACGHNSAVQLYPRMVKALSAKEFYADGDGSLYLDVSRPKLESVINGVNIDPFYEGSPMVDLLNKVLELDQELCGTKCELGDLITEVPDGEVGEADFLTIDQSDIQPFKPVESETPADIAEGVENQFIEWLGNPKDRIMVLFTSSNRKTASDMLRRYAVACEYNRALSIYPKFVSAFVHGEFNAENGSLNLEADSGKVMDIIKPLLKNIDFTLAKVSPMVRLLQSICDKWMTAKETMESDRAVDVTYTDNAPGEGDLNVADADVDNGDDFSMPLPEEYTVSDKAPEFNPDDSATDYNHSYDEGFVPPLENHEAQYVHVDNCDALGQQSITVNQSGTPLLNQVQMEEVPLTEKPSLPDGLGMPLYTISSDTNNPIEDNISLTDLANKTIAGYLVDRGIVEPSRIYDRLRNEGMKSARISEIIGMVKYLTLKG